MKLLGVQNKVIKQDKILDKHIDGNTKAGNFCSKPQMLSQDIFSPWIGGLSWSLSTFLKVYLMVLRMLGHTTAFYTLEMI